MAAAPRRVLERFRAVLLDMHGTFMFDEDRFGPAEDYHATYRALGGRTLDAHAVRAAITACYDAMDRAYRDPARLDRFPGLADVMRAVPPTAGLDGEELAVLQQVFARHEVGRVSDAHARALARLASTHRLGVVSDIWAPKDPWLAELARAGVLDCFAVLVFSSDTTSVKPSRRLFHRAVASLERLGVARDEIVFVGDSLSRDVAGAAAAGLATIWLSPDGPPDGIGPDAAVRPDFVVPSLLALTDGEWSIGGEGVAPRPA